MVAESGSLGQLGADIASRLQGGEAAANVELIHDLPLNQQVIAKGAFHRLLKMMWIMYLAFATVGALVGLLIAVHPLSKEHQAAQLGLVQESTATDEQPAVTTEGSTSGEGAKSGERATAADKANWM
ncbi:hypothetical protein LZ30DRAFT_247403 [Colletotrichum cereale]|nr:hypothetical protein LZ30DRAFT_247403 [Colletotrichum cereale]